jgi:hypothetical protein
MHCGYYEQSRVFASKLTALGSGVRLFSCSPVYIHDGENKQSSIAGVGEVRAAEEGESRRGGSICNRVSKIKTLRIKSTRFVQWITVHWF